MPRQRKTISGANAQPAVSDPEQVYGRGQELVEMQRNMPTPASRPLSAAPVAAPVAVAPKDPAALLAAAGALREQTGLLTASTLRPNEPVTAGLSRGPGAGSSQLGAQMGSPTGNMLRRLSDLTGDPYLASLADRAGL